jgi:hypothetical protein
LVVERKRRSRAERARVRGVDKRLAGVRRAPAGDLQGAPGCDRGVLSELAPARRVVAALSIAPAAAGLCVRLCVVPPPGSII